VLAVQTVLQGALCYKCIQLLLLLLLLLPGYVATYMTLRAVASMHSSTRRPHASRADISAKALAAPVVDAMPVHVQ
jgi:hypothetical protein